MTARTLEEIEAQYSKGRGDGAPHMAPLGVMIENFPRLLAIAQEQRAELSAVFAAIDEVDAACEDQAYGWSERKDAARKNLQLLRNKRKIGTKR